MKRNTTIILLSFLIIMGSSKVGWTAGEERILNQSALTINKTTPLNVDEDARLEALSKQFSFPKSHLIELRRQKMSWGDIIVNLAVAQRYQMVTKQTLTLEQALGKIEDLRNQQFNWTEIAFQLSFELTPVVSEVRRAENNLRVADLPAREKEEYKVKADRPLP